MIRSRKKIESEREIGTSTKITGKLSTKYINTKEYWSKICSKYAKVHSFIFYQNYRRGNIDLK